MSDAPTTCDCKETVDAALIGCTDGLDRGELYGDDKGRKPSMSVYFRKPWSTYFGPQWERGKVKFKRGMYGRAGILERVGNLIACGRSNGECERLAGVTGYVVKKLRHVLETERGEPFKCQCGQVATHQGWCSWRFSRSLKRKQFMAGWHTKRSNGADEGRAERAQK